MTCLYEQSGGHSPKIGEANDGTPIYGMWENYETTRLRSSTRAAASSASRRTRRVIYHYHVQSKPPFTFGCYGPAMDGGLVTVEECRATYTECGDGDVVDLTTKDGTFEYDHWCPCYDADGSNVGVAPLALGAQPPASPTPPSPPPSPPAGPPPPSAPARYTDDPDYFEGGWRCSDWRTYGCLRGGWGIETEAAKAALSPAVSCGDSTPVCPVEEPEAEAPEVAEEAPETEEAPRRGRRRPGGGAAPHRRPGLLRGDLALRRLANSCARGRWGVETEVAKKTPRRLPGVVQGRQARLRGEEAGSGESGKPEKPAGPPEGKPEGGRSGRRRRAASRRRVRSRSARRRRQAGGQAEGPPSNDKPSN